MESRFRNFIETHISANEMLIADTLARSFFKSKNKNTTLLQAGEICNEFYFISKGAVRVYFLTQQGSEKTRFITLENTIITSLSSFISQTPAFEYIEAIEDIDVFAISHENFFSLITKYKEWKSFYVFILETAYINQTKRIEIRSTMCAKQRYSYMIKNEKDLVQRVSNKILSSYLDITQETLSRLKSK